MTSGAISSRPIRRSGAPTWVVILLAILVPPVGLIAIWWKRGPANVAKIVGTVVTALWTIVWLISVVTAAAERPPSKAAAVAPVAATSTASAPTATTAPTAEVALAAASAPPATDAASALQVLSALPVKGRAPQTGYDRDQFGQAWADVDRNGCDTRNDVLRRDLTNVVLKSGSNGCAVQSGTLLDPYSGAALTFTRGGGAVEIDHVVALSDAWQTGAQQLDVTTRTAFANDPANLRAVDAALNAQKSDADAASWLPPNTAFRCDYVATQIAVKAKYGLWVTAAEHDAMVVVLAGCTGAPTTTAVPSSAAPSVANAPTTASPAPATTAAPAPPAAETTAAAPPPAPAPADVYYANCDAARAAGAAPLYAGQPGYRPGLDGDHDGVACEPKR